MKAMRIWSMGALWRGWDRWRKQMWVTGKLKQMASRWTNLHSCRAWARWCEQVSEARRLQHCGRRAMSRWGQAVQWRAFATWQGAVLKIAAVKRAMSKALARWGSMLLRKAFLRWEFLHDAYIEQSAYVYRASRFRNLWLIGRFWKHWYCGFSVCCRAKAVIMRLVQRACGPDVKQSKIGNSVVRLLLTLSFSRALWMSWQSWRKHMEQCKQCWRMVQLNMFSTKSAGLIKWREWLAHRHRKMHDKRFFIQRNMRTIKLVSFGKWNTWHLGCKKSKMDAFAAWKEWAHECRRKVQIENIVVGLSNRKILVSLIGKWRAMGRRLLHCQQISRLFRLDDKDAPQPDAVAFRAWKTTINQERQRRVALNVFLNASCFSAFVTWRENARKQIRLCKTLSKAVLRIRCHAVAAAFDLWTCHAREQKIERFILQKAVKCWSYGALKKGLLRWSFQTENRSRLRGIVAKSLERWIQREKLRCWCTWLEHNRLMRVVKTIVTRFRCRKMCAAIHTWIQHVLEKICCRRKVTIIILRCGNAHKWRAFSTWHQNISDAVRIKNTIMRAMSRWLRLLVSVPFETWRSNMEYVKGLRTCARAVVRRWNGAACWQALGRWVEVTREIRRMRGMQMKAMRIWSMGALWRGWDRWRKQMWVTGKLKQMASRWTNLHSCRAWARWCEQVSEARRLQHCGRRAMSRWGQAVQWRAFATWHQHANNLIQARKVMICWKQRRLVCFFELWRVSVVKNQSNFATLQKIIRIWQHTDLMNAFRAWFDHLRSCVKMKTLTCKVTTRWNFSSLWRSWASWTRRMRIVQISRRMLTRWQLLNSIEAIDRWKEQTLIARRLRCTCTRIILHMVRSLCWKTFNIWTHSASESKRFKAAQLKAVSRWTNGVSIRAVTAWQLACTDAKRMRTLVHKSISRWTKSVQSIAMGTWKENILDVQMIRDIT